MDLVPELRRRLDVPVDLASDVLLQHFVDVAAADVGPWLVADPAAYQANVDEATVQLAVKMWDTQARGVGGYAPDGQWAMPAPSSSPGLVRSVFGALGPALRAGGASV